MTKNRHGRHDEHDDSRPWKDLSIPGRQSPTKSQEYQEGPSQTHGTGASIEQLTLQVSDLVSRLDSVPVGTSAAAPVTDLGDWELVGEPALPFGFSSAEELSKLQPQDEIQRQ